ncbi:Aquaporin-4 [Tulasnella sp. 419]|nr:Aquaporin-4 [Tulasnella sp. 419]
MPMMSPSRFNSRALFATWKDDVQVAALELAGTFLFLLLGLGGIQAAAASASAQQTPEESEKALNAIASLEQLIYISTSMGLSLLVSAWFFYRVTGGLFNPNITTALFLIGAIGPLRWMLCCVAQLIGAVVASGVLYGLTPGELAVNTTLSPGVSKSRGVFLEMFLTAALVLAVLMLAAEKHRTTSFAPIGVGLTLFAGHLWGCVYTGSSMNTARSFGPSVIVGFESNHWVYWLGPFLGSILATLFYTLLKLIRYWRLNPAQDGEHWEDSPDPLGNGFVNSIRGYINARQPSADADQRTTDRAEEKPSDVQIEHVDTRHVDNSLRV